MPKEETMDWFDDFDNDAFMDEDTEMDDPLDSDSEYDAELDQTESQGDGFTTRDAFFLGSAMGFGYEEGLRERIRRKRKRFIDDDSD
jgi:hypothetical protein